MEAAVEQTTTTTTAGGGSAPDHEDAAPKDITNISKGKRTKRQRPQSPILFTFSSTNNNEISNSPVSSSGFPAGSTTTEDEDTAESLILLSQGQSLDVSSRKNKDDYDGSMFKFNSKRYIQTSTTGNTGIFVYECRTCNRTFPSFQALGGHRASHKKPKNNEELRKPPPYMVVTDNESPNYNSSGSLQLNNRVSLIGSTGKSSSKLHECSICGTEFNSGQALGGHMRRHRVAGGGNKGGNNGTMNTNATTLSLIPFSPMNSTVEIYDKKSKNNALCLDLNLPAPREAAAVAADDDQRQKRGFTFSPTGGNENKQPAVQLSATPTLVDCHY
ncbi:hypothetical protein L2E82_22795 [Cichorium intybus]|uniref:Uncharacterized protein n=1 Tax=Cichorium intybus TaxID=13427 RepID=A0ACB9DY77_CICIN|nr:hypothetical protein L2E82_22795 [Cichorium intybus]